MIEYLGAKKIVLLECKCCGKKLEIDITDGFKKGEFLLYVYREHGWTCHINWDDKQEWYCEEHKPENFEIDPNKHPCFIDDMDYWEKRAEKDKQSRELDEPFDKYAEWIHTELCHCCQYRRVGVEDDWSTWEMCAVRDPSDHYGHNLYSGHFYGAAIRGRFCPYFTCGRIVGRDPIEDKKNGTFQIPYDERYDGD